MYYAILFLLNATIPNADTNVIILKYPNTSTVPVLGVSSFFLSSVLDGVVSAVFSANTYIEKWSVSNVA